MPKKLFSQVMAVVMLAVLVLSACAQVPRVGVAHPALGGGVNPADYVACEAQARMQAGDPTSQAVQGGAVGALGGAAVGAAGGAIGGWAAGVPGRGAAIGAAAGALLGILGGAVSQAQAADQAFQNAFAACMQAKGYIVR